MPLSLFRSRRQAAGSKGATRPPSLPAGFCDGLSDGRVHGWAWRPDAPADTLEVEVLLDGEIVGRALADADRPDLREAGIGNGRYGWSVALPKVAGQPRSGEVLVRLKDGAVLERGAFVIDPAPGEEVDASLDDTPLVRRNKAYVPGAGPRPDWPPTLADPFPGFHGVPEIDAARLDADLLGGAIQHHGGLLVRNLFKADAVASLAEAVERSMHTASAERASGQASKSAWFDPYPLGSDGPVNVKTRKWVLEGGGVFTADSPAAFDQLTKALRAAGVIDAIEGYLAEEVYMSVGKSTLRKVPPTSGTGWHQDGAFLGEGIRVVNCWLALTPCGIDAPGLDLFPRRLPQVLETGGPRAGFSWSVCDGLVEDLAAETPIVSPQFAAGDALLFDQLFLHRTGVRPGMTRDRLAIETWLFAGSSFPMEQIPLSLRPSI